jgi:Xaa-Pro aminopeptidase
MTCEGCLLNTRLFLLNRLFPPLVKKPFVTVVEERHEGSLNRLLLLLAFVIPNLHAPIATAQRFVFPPEEFKTRRVALAKAAAEGDILMLGASGPLPGLRFRQDNDFYYLTGSEDLNAVLVMDAAKGESFLFLPVQNEAQVRVDGPNWLHDAGAAKARGFTALHPLPYLEEFLARRRKGGPQPLWVRLSERDEVDGSRGDTALHLARRQNSSFGGQPSEDAHRVAVLRARYPYYELKDIVPHLDRLRVIKSPREIEALRRAGKVSAEGIRRAIEATSAGRYEYELEAEAAYVFLRNGAESQAYPAIAGSGPNVNVWHYMRNDRRMQDGDLVVMDYGASMGYETMDITRTWPVSGTFGELQLRAYRCVLEAQKAIIAAMRPGATRAQTREICSAIYKKWGFEEQRTGQAGHFVGLAVHDVGDPELPFAPGMVIAVEPIIELRDKQLHIRIEDTVLITDGEPEILSAAVPKEPDEVAALVGAATRVSKRGLGR